MNEVVCHGIPDARPLEDGDLVKIDVTAFLDSNKVYVQGLPDVKGDLEAFWDDTDTTLFTAAASTAAVRMYLYPSQDALTKYAYGLAWIDASMDCSVSDAVKIKSSFVAGGSWSQNF